MRFDPSRFWYKKTITLPAILLLPLSWLFRLISSMRRLLYRSGLLTIERVHMPVIVVGNITAGGTGKTPFVIALVQQLKALGYKPGVVSRGYGGSANKKPTLVKSHHTASEVGDEALVIARNTGSPIVVGKDRAAAARVLLATSGVDVVISDDGLQHYALGRDIEIAVVDSEREVGNGQLLPAGPLREPQERLDEMDYIVQNGGELEAGRYSMAIVPEAFRSVQNHRIVKSLDGFAGQQVHAVAGIGNPDKFFKTLKGLGINLVQHPFEDHFHFYSKHLDFNDNLPIVMTEKDAAKCTSFASQRYWYLRIAAKIDDRLINKINSQLKRWGEQHASKTTQF